MNTPDKPIGVVGLGLIGTSLAQRLLRAGFKVHGYDIDPKCSENLRALGGVAAATARDVGRACQVVILAVFDTPQVEDVLEGPVGIAPDAGQIVLCVTTCDPDPIVALNERLALRGVRFLEVPLSGNSSQIALGNGVALVGGDKATMDEVGYALAAISKQQFHLGPVGSGGRAKLAVNLVGGLNRAVLKLKGTRREKSLQDIAVEKCGLALAPHARYDYLLNLPEKEDIAKAIRTAMASIEQSKPELQGVLPQDEYNRFNRSEQNTAAIQEKRKRSRPVLRLSVQIELYSSGAQ